MVTKEINTLKHTCHLDLCAVNDAMQIVGGKWKNSIIFVVGGQNKIRFNQLKKAIPNISQKMLTQQLRELERDGLILREAYPEIPPRVEYSVTALGMTLEGIYTALNQWQQKHINSITKNRNKYDQRLK